MAPSGGVWGLIRLIDRREIPPTPNTRGTGDYGAFGLIPGLRFGGGFLISASSVGTSTFDVSECFGVGGVSVKGRAFGAATRLVTGKNH